MLLQIEQSAWTITAGSISNGSSKRGVGIFCVFLLFQSKIGYMECTYFLQDFQL